MIAERRADVADLNERARAHLREAGKLGKVELELPGGAVAVGDAVVIKRNDLRLSVANGQRGRVTAVDPAARALTLKLGDAYVRLDRACLDDVRRGGDPTLLHGYAITGHVAQGATVDRSFVLAGQGISSEWAYVALSRGRLTNQLYLPLTRIPSARNSRLLSTEPGNRWSASLPRSGRAAPRFSPSTANRAHSRTNDSRLMTPPNTGMRSSGASCDGCRDAGVSLSRRDATSASQSRSCAARSAPRPNVFTGRGRSSARGTVPRATTQRSTSSPTARPSAFFDVVARSAASSDHAEGHCAPAPAGAPLHAHAPVVPGPAPAANALVEDVWREVSSVRPDNRARLSVDCNLAEAIRSTGVGEHRSTHALQDVDLALKPIVES